MAHGLPFIATDSTGLREMMDFTPECLIHINEENFEPDEFINQLAKRMELLLSNSKLRKQCSQQLQQLYRKRYTLDCMRNAMEKLLNSQWKAGNYLSKDFIHYLDREVIRLINSQPILDLDNIGLTGIGCYLWWRIKSIKDRSDLFIKWQLQEYLVYYIDWMSEVIDLMGTEAFSEGLEIDPLLWLLNELKITGFYPTKLDRIYKQITILGIGMADFRSKNQKGIDILQTMLKIYNLQL